MGPLVENSLKFFYDACISPSFLKEVFAVYKFFKQRLFSFSTLETSFRCLLSSVVSVEESL